MYSEIKEFSGKTFRAVYKDMYADVYSCGGPSDAIIFEVSDDEKYAMFHSQDCCESVWIEDICGDLSDLVGSPILVAERRYESDDTVDMWDGIRGWTFYEIATIKGSVTIRWCGSSNGYYSIGVSIDRFPEIYDESDYDGE